MKYEQNDFDLFHGNNIEAINSQQVFSRFFHFPL